MALFENGILEQPVPGVATLEEVNQGFNENFELIRNSALNKRGAYSEEISINNANSPKQIVKTTKDSSVLFNITNATLIAKLPLQTDLNSYDKVIASDNSGLAGTYNCTIQANGNKINGVVEDYVLDLDNASVEFNYINDIVGFIATPSSVITGSLSPLLEYVLCVTNNFSANEVITLSTGHGAIAGIASVFGTAVLLPASSPLFKKDGRVAFYLNGKRLSKEGTTLGVVWDSTNSFHINVDFNIGDELLIIAPKFY